LKRNLPSAFNNLTSLVGAILASVALAAVILLILLEFTTHQSHPYLGMITFIILPGVMFFGLLLVLIGFVRARRRERRRGTPEALPRIDLNSPRHRRGLAFFSVGALVFLGLSLFGSYHAYEYTETVAFCGTICHKVMEPEHTAYMGSPHARVSCTECHIGSGATWFVRSKVTGTYQVYSTLFNKYPKPIPTPIENLRPAAETCEQCHWPSHFYSAKLQSHTYFSDESAPSRLDMLMKIGGGDPEHGAAEGIHAHMYVANKIEYVATDREREKIPYVKSIAPDGTETVYRSTEQEVSDEDLKNGHRRTVDCIDCHNRPTHIYRHPARSVNQAMERGLIPRDLPGIKSVAVESLEGEYATKDEALAGIRKAVTEHFSANQPEAAKTRAADIDKAVGEIQQIYSRNYFPGMKVSWKAYPDHIGHMYSDGCFRCHDGKHVSDTGKVITNDCNVCHTMLSQSGAEGKQQVSMSGQQFQHPSDVGDAWKEMKCSECHGVQEE